ncbi:uncharacterized membrane protein-like protein [Tanacetum coccineum]
MSSRFPSHQLSSGLYVLGRPEPPKEKASTMSSTAAPYTGGDIKKSGELGKMFDVDHNGSLSGGVFGSGSMKKTSFGPLNKHGEPIRKSSGPQGGGMTSRQNYGPLPLVLPAIGLITSVPLNSSGAPRKSSVALDSSGSIKTRTISMVKNPSLVI